MLVRKSRQGSLSGAYEDPDSESNKAQAKYRLHSLPGIGQERGEERNQIAKFDIESRDIGTRPK